MTELNEKFYDKLHSLQHSINYVTEGFEQILSKYGEEGNKYLNLNIIISSMKKIEDKFNDLKKESIPTNHPEDCKCSCVICGEDHTKLKGKNPYKCDASGYCPYWSCC